MNNSQEAIFMSHLNFYFSQGFQFSIVYYLAQPIRVTNFTKQEISQLSPVEIFLFTFTFTFITFRYLDFLFLILKVLYGVTIPISNRIVRNRNGILLPKLFWPTVRKNVPAIENKFWNSRLKAENLQKFWDH